MVKAKSDTNYVSLIIPSGFVIIQKVVIRYLKCYRLVSMVVFIFCCQIPDLSKDIQ